MVSNGISAPHTLIDQAIPIIAFQIKAWMRAHTFAPLMKIDSDPLRDTLRMICNVRMDPKTLYDSRDKRLLSMKNG